MEKLTLEHIAPYLPYGLFLKVFNNIDFYKSSGFKLDSNLIPIILFNGLGTDIENCKPILRRMNLTKPIIHNGKEEIPIIELARIAFPEKNWRKNSLQKMAIAEQYSSSIEFRYLIKNKCFCNNWKTITPNQLQLFKYLYSRMFDVEGLIDAGLAIDVDTLTENPYK